MIISPQKYTADLPKDVIRSEFVRAMSMWSGVADVSWREVSSQGFPLESVVRGSPWSLISLWAIIIIVCHFKLRAPDTCVQSQVSEHLVC